MLKYNKKDNPIYFYFVQEYVTIPFPFVFTKNVTILFLFLYTDMLQLYISLTDDANHLFLSYY